ncbi:MAG: transposase [Acidovorax sp.]|uniref:transposase n=1 Tax=Acidovorax sp. TaxID=1872122 RepID=UPI0026061D24|nr:transposase [Acidovorax sp.]MDH4415936.1 transposase [Acidovorax sp.]
MHATWFGLAPCEYSSGRSRYLRMLLTHGARSALRATQVAQGAGKQVLGAGCSGAQQPQQGHLRAGQQAGAHLLCDAARSQAV